MQQTKFTLRTRCWIWPRSYTAKHVKPNAPSGRGRRFIRERGQARVGSWLNTRAFKNQGRPWSKGLGNDPEPFRDATTCSVNGTWSGGPS
jgi:hypothetical protein